MKGGKLNKDEIERIKYLNQAQGLMPIGVDVASRVFQVCYWDLSKERIINFQLERAKFFEFIDNLASKSLFGIEACGSCHYLSRTINAKGHECRILPAGKVKAFLNLDKTDKIDALGILKTLITPSIDYICPREEDNQILLNLLTLKELVNKQMVQTINEAHAFIYELGNIVEYSGVKNYSKLITEFELLKERLKGTNQVSYEHFTVMADALTSSLNSIKDRLNKIDAYIMKLGRSNQTCINLTTIPGIGIKTAVAIYAALGDASRFRSARSFAAFIGVAPKVTGTGGKTTVLGVRKVGWDKIKRALYMGALSYLSAAIRNGTESSWLKIRLEQNKSKKLLICAIMNRLVRIAYSIAKNGGTFDESKCNLIKKLR